MMNLKELLNKQYELDKMILEKADIKEYPYLNIKLALLVELGELANEVQSFKHWKKNKNVNRERVLEEFADCLHFALSLENEHRTISEYTIINFNLMINKVKVRTEHKEISNAFLTTYICALEDTSRLMAILSLGKTLGFSLEEMEQAYLKKHQENIRRQQEGY